MGKSQTATIGHRYYLGIQAILNFGRLDALRMLRFKEKVAWSGTAVGGTEISVDQEELFGGKEAEGGVKGTVTVQDGNTSQTADSYLTQIYQTNEQGGKRVPAFRAVSQLIFGQPFYWGQNPFFPAWDAVGQRITYTGHDGAEQWYLSKAKIPGDDLPGATVDDLEYDPEYPGGTNEFLSVASTPVENVWSAGSGDGGTWYVEPDSDISDYPSLTQTGFDDDYFLRMESGSVGSAYSAVFYVDLESLAGSDYSVDAQLTCDLAREETGGAQIHGLFASIYTIPTLSDSNILNPTASGTLEASVSISPSRTTDWTPKDTGAVSITNGQAGIVVRISGTVGHSVRNLRLTLSGESFGSQVYDMNPAHIIRECLTDQHFGRRVPDAEIDDTSFQAVANTLFNEGFGLSFKVNWKNTTPDDVIGMVERHADIRHYTHRSTGKHTLKAIREDYDPDTIPAFTDADVLDADVAIESLHELPNTVTLKYWSWPKFDFASISDTNHAKAQVDGGIDNEELDFPGITKPALAGKVLARELRASTVPKLHGTLVLNREGYDLHPGDPFKVTDSRFGLSGQVLRVIEADIGDLTQNRIVIKFVEDAFGLGNVANITGEDQASDNITTDPAVVQNRVVQEAPYYSLVRAVGDTEANAELTDDPTVGFIHAAALSPGGSHLLARIHVDDGAGYVEQGALDFAPGATLTAAAGKYDTTLSATSTAGMDVITYPVLAQIGNELIRIDSKASGSLTVGRGCFDTIPAEHASGAKVVVISDYEEILTEEYNASDTPDVKLQSVTGSGALALASATADTITMANRAIRPYPPGQVQIESTYTPTELNDGDTLSWVHRDRLTQTSATILDHTGAGVGPEANTIYRVDYFAIDVDGNEAGSAYFTTDGSSPALTGTSYTLNEADYKTGAPATAREARIQITTERDGYDSWQSPSFVLPIFAPRTSEAGVTRTDEAGATRVKET